MKVRTALLVILCTALSEACQRPEEPVRGTFGPYEIVFPQSARQALERYPVAVDSMDSWRLARRDSLRSLFLTVGLRENRGASYNLDREVYAVSFFLPLHQTDSLKYALQQQWGGQWQERRTTSGPWGLMELEYKHLAVKGPLDITIQPFRNYMHVIPPTVMVSFCYELTEKELNFFVARQGNIIPDD
jgi:hypothetical protein